VAEVTLRMTGSHGGRDADVPAQETVHLLPSALLAARFEECLQTYRTPENKPLTLRKLATRMLEETRSPERPNGVGASFQYLSKLKQGNVRPSPDVLRALARIFGKPAGYFLASSRDELEALDAQVELWQALREAGITGAAARALSEAGFARSPGTSAVDSARPATDVVTLRLLATAIRNAVPTSSRSADRARPATAPEVAEATDKPQDSNHA